MREVINPLAGDGLTIRKSIVKRAGRGSAVFRRLVEMDKDGNGDIDLPELLDFVDSEITLSKSNANMKRVIFLLVLFVALLVGANFGLTFVAIEKSKETQAIFGALTDISTGDVIATTSAMDNAELEKYARKEDGLSLAALESISFEVEGQESVRAVTGINKMDDCDQATHEFACLTVFTADYVLEWSPGHLDVVDKTDYIAPVAGPEAMATLMGDIVADEGEDAEFETSTPESRKLLGGLPDGLSVPVHPGAGADKMSVQVLQMIGKGQAVNVDSCGEWYGVTLGNKDYVAIGAGASVLPSALSCTVSRAKIVTSKRYNIDPRDQRVAGCVWKSDNFPDGCLSGFNALHKTGASNDDLKTFWTACNFDSAADGRCILGSELDEATVSCDDVTPGGVDLSMVDGQDAIEMHGLYPKHGFSQGERCTYLAKATDAGHHCGWTGLKEYKRGGKVKQRYTNCDRKSGRSKARCLAMGGFCGSVKDKSTTSTTKRASTATGGGSGSARK